MRDTVTHIYLTPLMKTDCQRWANTRSFFVILFKFLMSSHERISPVLFENCRLQLIVAPLKGDATRQIK